MLKKFLQETLIAISTIAYKGLMSN